MKKIVLLSTLTAALLASFGAHAADTTELKVSGNVVPPACVPSFVGGENNAKYGDIAANRLITGAYLDLGSKELSFGLTCNAITKIALKLKDDRSASRVAGIVDTVSNLTGGPKDSYNFGLGTANQKNIGGYVVSFTSAMADNKAVNGIFSNDSGKTWNAGAGYFSHSGQYFSFAESGTTLAFYKTLTVKFNVQAFLNKRENLDMSSNIPLDGLATIEVVYL